MYKCFLVAIFFLVVCISQVDAAGYNGDWLYRIPITINASQVNGDQTDFPVYIDLSDLDGTGLFANANSNGSDLRVTKSDGTTEVPIELVFFDTGATNGGELHFKASGTLSGTSNSDWYLYYGNSAASAYASSATYGRDNVWTGYQIVSHYQQDPSGSAPQATDSTGNSFDGTSAGSMVTGDLVSGKLAGQSWEFDGSNDYVDHGDVNATSLGSSGSDSTISVWVKRNVTGANQQIIQGRRKTGSTEGIDHFLTTTNKLQLRFTPTSGAQQTLNSATSFNNTNFNKVDIVYDGDTPDVTLYVNSSVDGTINASSVTKTWSLTSGVADLDLAAIGSFAGVNYLNGIIDEFRLSTDEKSSNWLSTEYNNQNSPSTFYSVGTQEANPGTGGAEANVIFFGTVF